MVPALSVINHPSRPARSGFHAVLAGFQLLTKSLQLVPKVVQAVRGVVQAVRGVVQPMREVAQVRAGSFGAYARPPPPRAQDLGRGSLSTEAMARVRAGGARWPLVPSASKTVPASQQAACATPIGASLGWVWAPGG